MTPAPDPERVQSRADALLSEEVAAGSGDPEKQAEQILADSDARSDHQLAPHDKPVEHRESEDTVDLTD